MKKIILLVIFLFASLNSFSQKINPKLLQGKWQSIDDKRVFLIFTNNLRKEITTGMDDWETKKYTLSKGLGNSTCINQVIDNKNVSIWAIESLNSEELTLYYLRSVRGNSLRYRRVK
ncbi:DUF2147 domain-containing protein [Flavobacterium laiguense]|uniref:Lipocalin-like domain-containing protein n=1 Tax=Flavobacterium laiguense TaxID=2169409 RepID=A0A2U1JX65_9FLAO|nr:hypothetical protein [Flavobacterium laiguense]PWA09534.1 hypothetical protein DB891_07580 [Flavobacterium laiguense]